MLPFSRVIHISTKLVVSMAFLFREIGGTGGMDGQTDQAQRIVIIIWTRRAI